jgi:heavy metal sensor kinase
MKSIRLSLLLYFLMLVAVALGAASALAYQSSESFLKAKEEARAELLNSQYKRNCGRTRGHLDRMLMGQARALASQVLIQFTWNHTRIQALAPLVGLSCGPNPGALVARWWLATHSGGREVIFDEEHLPRDPELTVPEYFQIDSDWGRTWRSRSMSDRSFPIDLKEFKKMQLGEMRPLDEEEFEPGIHVKRVLFKTTISRFSFLPGPRPERLPSPARRGGHGDFSEWPRPGPRERPAPPPREGSSPAILIHFAAETSQLEDELAKLKTRLDEDLANLKEESRATLASMRNRLLLISLATFAATVVGGFWLVRVGLAPLQRLSEAVSQVSAKDFRLPIEESQLPGELRPIADRLSQTLDLLKRAFAREKQAAADISHELRTPLAALLTTIEVGLRKPRAADEYRELLADCHATGQQMSQLVERLLALARLDAGVDTLRPRTVDVANLAEQCANLVRPLAVARQLTLRVHRNGPVSLNTDPDKLREILTNLLHNAIEYNRPGGNVDLTVDAQNAHLNLEVRDTGIGITPEAREHIFERFYRADSSRHADGLHAGLGLAIVKGYVDLMGGTIAVESSPGQGSVFRVELPSER